MARFNPKKARRVAEVEWVGGRFASPGLVTGEGEPYRPEIVVWIDVTEDALVYAKPFGPGSGPASLSATLEEAMARPMDPRVRPPTRVRVARADDAAELRARFSPRIGVVVGPTPEVREAAELIEEEAAAWTSPDNWLERLPASDPAVARFFEAASRLYPAAPWELLDADDEIHVDIPALGVHGACVTLIGNEGEPLGFLMFPSLVALDAFSAAVAPHHGEDERPDDYGTDWLAVEFEPSGWVPDELEELIAEHALPLAAPEAVPWPNALRRDGLPAPLTLETLTVLGAVSNALACLADEHEEALASGEPLSIVVESNGYPRVRLSLPYEAGAEHAAPAPPLQRVAGRRSPAHDLDERVTKHLLGFASAELGDDFERFQDDLSGPVDSLASAWALYVFEVEGRPVFEHYLEDESDTLSAPERDWLLAQRRAWASYWEVTATLPGEQLNLRDLLSGETRVVYELAASRSVPVRAVLFARVVDYGDHSVIVGMHPRALGPSDADAALRSAKQRLRAKTKARLAPEELRPYATARVLLDEWQRAVAADDVRRATPPKLQNTDGDPLLLTVDHYAFAPAARAEVVRRLAELPGAEPEQPGSDSVAFMAPGNAIRASWENTVIGRAEPRANGLRVEANSIRRADALRARVEAALGQLVTHRAREHADPVASLAGGAPGGPDASASQPLPPEALAVLHELKARHMREWLDTPVPALGSKTPRAAAKNKAGRTKLDVLLREIELMESRLPADSRGDIGWLRRELGME